MKFPKNHFKNKFRDLKEGLKYPLGIFIEGLAEGLILIFAVMIAIIYTKENFSALFSLRQTIVPLMIIFFMLVGLRSLGKTLQESAWRKRRK